MNKEILLEVGKRVKLIRMTLHINQRDFAQKLDVSGSYLSEVESGKSKAGFDFLYAVSKLFHVNVHYILHGIGDMFTADLSTSYMASKEPGEQIESFSEVIWYVERSQLLRHMLIGMAAKFIYENDQLIKMEIERYNRSKEAKATEKPFR